MLHTIVHEVTFTYNTAGMDFTPHNATPRTFEPKPVDEQEVCINITVLEDELPEENEVFSVALSTSDAAVTLASDSSMITILNNDGRY